MKLSFGKISKQFYGLPVINDFSREIEEAELMALVGPSGCGKYLAAGLGVPTGRWQAN